MQPFTLSARFYPPDLLNNNSLSLHQLFVLDWIIPISREIYHYFLEVTLNNFLDPSCTTTYFLIFLPLFAMKCQEGYCLTLPVPVLSVPLTALRFTHMEVTDAHLYVAKTVLSPHCS